MHKLGVVFDVDDTLYLEKNYVVSGFHAVGKWAAEWLAIPDFRDRCLDNFNNGRRGDIFDRVLCQCRGAATPNLVAALVEMYRTHSPAIGLPPDSEEMFKEIVGKLPMAVITDGPVTSQSRKCEALGLTAFATPILLTEMMGKNFRKPKVAAFAHLANLIDAKHFVYVADNPATDFTGPKHLGWTTVRVRRPGGLHYHRENDATKPDFEVSDCSGVPAILARLAKGG